MTTIVDQHQPATKPLVTLLYGLAIVIVGFAVPVLLASHYGALDIPRSDAWSYLRTLFVWESGGGWDFNNWVSMTLVGQIMLAAPIVLIFGHSVMAVNVTFAAIGVAGLLVLWRLGESLGLTRGASAFVAITIAASPLWGPLAPTYMTDVPVFVFAVAALTVAQRAFRTASVSMPRLAAAIAIGFVGVSIRQYGAIPLLAIFLTAALYLRAERDGRRLRILAGMGLVTGVAIVVMLVWWSSVPNGKSLAPAIPTTDFLKAAYLNGGGFLRLAGITLAPVIVFARPVAIVRRAFRTDRALAGLMLGVSAFVLITAYVPKRPFVGNYFARRGVLADDIMLPGVRPLVIPNWAFDLLVVIGTLGALVLVLALVPWITDLRSAIKERRVRIGDPTTALLGFTVAGFAMGYELALATGLPIFDRYALPALPLVALLLLRSSIARRALDAEPAVGASTQSTNRRVPILAGATLLVLAALGVAYTAESASFDGTRWKVAQLAVDHGFTHVQIDGGYEWVGWFRGDGPLTADTERERKRLRAGYYEGLCVSVLVDAEKMPPNVIASATSSALTRKPAVFVAYQNDRACSTGPDRGAP